MPHNTELIAILCVGFVLAFVLGMLAQRLKLSPLVGYLVVGMIAGPFTPGFVADQTLAPQLAVVAQRRKLVAAHALQRVLQGRGIGEILAERRALDAAPRQAHRVFQRGVGKQHHAGIVDHRQQRGQQVEGLKAGRMGAASGAHVKDLPPKDIKVYLFSTIPDITTRSG